MSRENFGVERGLDLFDENGELRVAVLGGTALPGGDGGPQDEAPVGSLYLRSNGTASTLFQKVLTNNNNADWVENGSSSAVIGVWRQEKVRAITNDTVTAGVARDLVANPFADDEVPLLTAADFAVGEFLIADADGTPVLLEVTDVSAPNVTFSTPSVAPPLAENDTFITPNYLPDSPGTQEGQAIANYNGSVILKIADIDFQFATGIELSAGYTAGAGDAGSPASCDSVEAAIIKLDGNDQAQDLVLGTARGDTTLPNFSGSTIPDGASVVSALQALETAGEAVGVQVGDLITLTGVPANSEDLGTFPGGVISDNVTIKTALTELEAKDEAQDLVIAGVGADLAALITLSGVPAGSTDLGSFTGDLFADNLNNKEVFQRIEDLLDQLKMLEQENVTTQTVIDEVPVAQYGTCKWLVEIINQGSPANKRAFEVYATNNGTLVDDTVYARLRIGTFFVSAVNVDISGGNMRLLVSSSVAAIVRARRIGVFDI